MISLVLVFVSAVFSESDVVSFDGSAHLLFRPDPSVSLADRDVLSMNFKTLLNSGMLVHMEEHSGHSFTLELFRGKLLLQLRKGTKTHLSAAGMSNYVLLC